MVNMFMPLIFDLLLLLIVFWLYWPSSRGPFLYDDLAILEGFKERADPLREHLNPIATLLHDIANLFRAGLNPRAVYNWLQYRPLTTATYHFNMHYGKGYKSTYGWHLVSTAIHAANSIVVLHILLHWFPLASAATGAFIFAAHPLATAAVSYLSGRSSALCSMFMLLAILCLLHHWYIPLVFVSALALLAKPEAVILPILLGGLWWLKLA